MGLIGCWSFTLFVENELKKKIIEDSQALHDVLWVGGSNAKTVSELEVNGEHISAFTKNHMINCGMSSGLSLYPSACLIVFLCSSLAYTKWKAQPVGI